MVRTMELLVGLKPLSQCDANAVPMWRLFHQGADRRAYIWRAVKGPDKPYPTQFDSPGDDITVVVLHRQGARTAAATEEGAGTTGTMVLRIPEKWPAATRLWAE